MLIEGGIRTRSRGARWSRIFVWADTSARTKTRFHSWGMWVDRWFGWEVELEKVSNIELYCSWGTNNNKVVGESCSLVECYLKGISNTTIDGVKGNVSGNF